MQIDLIIKSGVILTVNDNDQILYNHSIAINKGIIIDLIPNESDKYTAKTTVDKTSHTLIPGLINSHTHAAMSLFKGLAEDINLETWLNQHIWPAESQHVNKQFIHDGTTLAIAEMLQSGTTCFNDMYFLPDITAKASLKHNIRVALGLIVIDFATIWAKNLQEYIEKAIDLYKQHNGKNLIKLILAPHAPYSVCEHSLQEVLKIAKQLNIPIHMHIHETTQETIDYIEKHGIRPLEKLDALGMLNSKMIAVHMTDLTEKEIKRIQKTNTNIVHCPKSNLKLASGICDISLLTKKGINVALGTDSSASNNSLDMLNEMQFAALLAKGHSKNASSINASQVLRMATINGAKALGWDQQIGSLEINKQADIVALDMSSISTQPSYNPISQLVYSSSKQQITDVWVNGEYSLKNKKLCSIDEEELLTTVKQWEQKIAE